jgi:hypothetical protein
VRSSIKFYRDQDCTAAEAIPRIVSIVSVPLVKKDRPLISRYCKFATAKFLLDSEGKLSIEYTGRGMDSALTQDQTSQDRQDTEGLRSVRDESRDLS